MTPTIWKFDLELDDVQTVKMPRGAHLLHVACREGRMPPTVWAMVNPAAPVVDRRILIRGTGHPLPPAAEGPCHYLGTTIHEPFVWHVFDGGEVL